MCGRQAHKFGTEKTTASRTGATHYFRGGKTSPGKILQDVKGSIEPFVGVTRDVVHKIGKKKATSSDPSFTLLGLQIDPGGGVFGYWQHGTLLQSMPFRQYDDNGWGVGPNLANQGTEKLTAANCLIWISDFTHVDPGRETVTLTNTCSPERAAVQAVEMKRQEMVAAVRLPGTLRGSSSTKGQRYTSNHFDPVGRCSRRQRRRRVHHRQRRWYG